MGRKLCRERLSSAERDCLGRALYGGPGLKSGQARPCLSVPENMALPLVKMVSKSLFRTTAVGVETYHNGDRDRTSNTADSWGFIAKEQSEGGRGWKITKRKQG